MTSCYEQYNNFMPRHLIYSIFAFVWVALIGLTTVSSSRAESMPRSVGADSPYDVIKAVNAALRASSG